MKKHKGKHGSNRSNPEGYGHGHMEHGMTKHPGMVNTPHAHTPMGLGEEEHGHKHEPKNMGMP